MKTAISVPDQTFERASREAKSLGMSRSELFSRAVVHYLDDLEAKSTTAQIDAALERSVQRDDDGAVEAGRRVLWAIDDEW